MYKSVLCLVFSCSVAVLGADGFQNASAGVPLEIERKIATLVLAYNRNETNSFGPLLMDVLQDVGPGALFYALEHHHKNLLMMLFAAVRKGMLRVPNWDMVNTDGDSLWHVAVKNGMSDAFPFLKEFKVSYEIKNRAGLLPHQCSSDFALIQSFVSVCSSAAVSSPIETDPIDPSLVVRIAVQERNARDAFLSCVELSDDKLGTLFGALAGDEREWFLDQIVEHGQCQLCSRLKVLYEHDSVFTKNLEFRVLLEGDDMMVQALCDEGLSASPNPYGRTPMSVLFSRRRVDKSLMFFKDERLVQSLRVRDVNGRSPLFDMVTRTDSVSDDVLFGLIDAYCAHQAYAQSALKLLSDQLSSCKTLWMQIEELRPELARELNLLLREHDLIKTPEDFVVFGLRHDDEMGVAPQISEKVTTASIESLSIDEREALFKAIATTQNHPAEKAIKRLVCKTSKNAVCIKQQYNWALVRYAPLEIAANTLKFNTDLRAARFDCDSGRFCRCDDDSERSDVNNEVVDSPLSYIMRSRRWELLPVVLLCECYARPLQDISLWKLAIDNEISIENANRLTRAFEDYYTRAGFVRFLKEVDSEAYGVCDYARFKNRGDLVAVLDSFMRPVLRAGDDEESNDGIRRKKKRKIGSKN